MQEITWPIEARHGVYLLWWDRSESFLVERTLDLSPYIEPEGDDQPGVAVTLPVGTPTPTI